MSASATSRRAVVAVSLLLVTGGTLVARLDHGSLAAPAMIVAGTVLLWATRGLPEYLAAFILFTAAALSAVAPMPAVLSGFTGPAVWLVVSGAVIGAALRHSGLSDRLGRLIAAGAHGPFAMVIARIALVGTGLAFLMPSAMGRVLLIVPLLEDAARRLGFERGTRGREAILIAGVLGTFFPALAILPANVPNNVLAGLMETTGLGAPTFSDYLLLHFPVLGAAKLAVIIALMGFAYRDVPAVAKPDRAGSQPLSPAEMRLAILLALTIGLWLTDSWHGVSAAWVGMAAAVVCLWPGAGLTPPEPLKAINLAPVFYVAGVVALGALVDRSGLSARMADAIGGWLATGGNASALPFFGFVAIAAGLGLLVTVVGVPAILTPLADQLAAAIGISAPTLAMIQVVGFSTVFLPYQAPPLTVAILAGGLPARPTARLCLLTAVLTIALIWPLDYAWWRLLGRLP